MALVRGYPVAALVAAGFIVLAMARPVLADGGVALDLREITLGDQLDPGRVYELPQLTVRNPGAQVGTYRMSAGGIDNDAFSDPVGDWFRFDPAEFKLGVNDRQVVRIRVVLPEDALPGDYRGLLKAELMPQGDGPLVGVAAGARLSFAVAQLGGAGGLLRWLGMVLGALPPWTPLIALILLGLLAARVVGKRVRIRIEVR